MNRSAIILVIASLFISLNVIGQQHFKTDTCHISLLVESQPACDSSCTGIAAVVAIGGEKT